PRFHRPLVDPRRLRGFPTVPRDRAAAHGRTGHRSGGGKRGREMTDHDRAAPTAQALAEVIALHPGAADPAPDAGAAPAEGLPERVSAALEFLRRRLPGEYEVDDFGFDPDFNESVVLPVLRPLFDKWFRVDVRGIENLPIEGPA